MPNKSKNKTVTTTTTIRGGRKTNYRKPKHQKAKPKKSHRSKPKGGGNSSNSDYARYLRVLRNPFNNDPVRLGNTGVESSLFTTRTRLGYTATSTVTGYQFVASPYAQTPIQSSTLTSGTWSAWSVSGPTTPSAGTILATYAAARPVAGAIRLRQIANSSNDAGCTYGWLVPTSVSILNINTSGVANFPESVSHDARQGIQVTWRPQDPQDYQFNQNLITANTAYTQIQYPSMYLGIDNMAVGSSIEIEVIWHFEATLQTGYEGLISQNIGNMTRVEQENVLTGNTARNLLNSAVTGILDSANDYAYAAARTGVAIGSRLIAHKFYKGFSGPRNVPLIES